MTPEEIQAEWDAFIDYPSADKLYVTTTSALIFARSIVAMAEKRKLDTLRTQNQALLKALNGVMYWDNGKPEWDIARAAIELAEGKDV